MKIELTGKHALITGANSGIGRAIAEAFVEAGAYVAVNYLAHPRAARDLCDALNKKEERAVAIEADVSDPGRVSAMFARVDEIWDGLDILVNNAGVEGPRELAWEARVEDWRKVVETNLYGSFYCAQEALRRMVPVGRGVVINVTSVHELIPWTGYSAYTASKAALGMLTKTLAQEGGPHGVRVVGLAPGAIKSPVNRAVWEDRPALAALLEKIPVGELGEPEDVARMAVLLASDAARYVTGTTVFVDGGLTLFPAFTHGE